ncbi:hypothetical protein Hanom_Chr11g01022071 [Helianthus anomalus]
MEVEKVRALTSQVAQLNINHEFVSQRDLDVEKSRRAESENATNQALAKAQELSAQLATLRGEKTWWISHGVTSCFEFLRWSPHFSTLLDNMATAAYETGQHDGMHAAYSECSRLDMVTEELRATTASVSARLAETLSTVANDPLPEFQQILEAARNLDPVAIHPLLDLHVSCLGLVFEQLCMQTLNYFWFNDVIPIFC